MGAGWIREGEEGRTERRGTVEIDEEEEEEEEEEIKVSEMERWRHRGKMR